MTDRENRRQREQRDPTEGVRLIGADEAEEVLERDDIRHRLRDDEPRFGDRPPSPAPEGPRPALRFPLGSYDDPTTIERPAVVPVQPRTQAPELSHWAGSAAEEVPNMSRRDPRQGDPRQGDPRQGDPGQGDDAWSTFADSDPRWRDDPSMPPAGRPPSRPPGPPREPTRQQPGDTWPDPSPPAPPPGEPRPGAPVSYDDEVDQPPAPGRSVFADGGGEPPATYEDAYAEEGYADEYEPAYDETYDDVYEEDVYTDEPAAGAYPADPRGAVAAPRRRAPGRAPRRMPDRDLRTAVGVAVLFAAVALALFQFGEELGGMIVAVPVVTYAAYEYFVAANKAGHQAIMPVGVVATAALVIAAYNYGEGAIPLVMVLAIAVCFLWYLVRASTDEPVSNIGATLLGIGWIGLFGSFAGLLLSDPVGGNGVALLLAAVIPTIGYDVGALFVGRSAGSRPLSDASPNKTIEGLLGGMFLAVVAAVVFAGIVEVHPFDSIGEGITLGVLVALVAPLGDLSESLIKRDLGVKDMGSVLPGHGGLLDRFDALLFVLPAVWYLARVSDFFLT
ncbi:MAG TPA: phosphatidate cytidylyltransferase [Acidimicrobiales bacterium]|nr:phosphatidate cytidylyltransferase [Acidimicrobiales bacterium]